MPDREKVIEGLEETEIMLIQAVDRGGEMAVMGAFKCLNHVTDALVLLKEQEPRVLTLEEARTYEVVWPEDKGEGKLHPLIVENNMNDSKYYKYGVHWRVWSAKPTDEQRKAVKWNV